MIQRFTVTLLLPHVQFIMELIQRCLADEERPETVVRLSLGLVGDLAETFPNGEIKQLLLVEWLASILRAKPRFSSETKRTLKWTKEVLVLILLHCLRD